MKFKFNIAKALFIFFCFFQFFPGLVYAQEEKIYLPESPLFFDLLKKLPPAMRWSANSVQRIVFISPERLKSIKQKTSFSDLVQKGSFDYSKKEIYLDRSLLLENKKEELAAAFIHFVAHIYDRMAYEALSRDERFNLYPKLIQLCKVDEIQDNVSQDSVCRIVKNQKTLFSENPFFLSSFGVRFSSSDYFLENLIPLRAVNLNEFSSLYELFPSNMEKFILDKEYKCRKPTQYNYLKKHFNGFDPSERMQCSSVLPLMKVDFNRPELIFLDVERVFRVDYVLVSSSKFDMAGMLGHVLLRLAVCAPWRKEVSAECLKDQDHHIVISYSAPVNELTYSAIMAANGGYPLSPNIYSLKEALHYYVDLTERNLKLFPLDLKHHEIVDLLKQMVFQHWALERNYFLLSNNCGLEVYNLLRSTLQRENLFFNYPMSPHNTYAQLNAIGLIKEKNPIEIFEANKNYWQSLLNELLEIDQPSVTYDSIPSRGNGLLIAVFMNKNIFEREKFYNSILQSGVRNSPARRLLVNKILILEKRVRLYKDEVQMKLVTKVLDYERNKDIFMSNTTFILRNAGWFTLLNEHQASGYGTPLNYELANVRKNLEINQRLVDDFYKNVNQINDSGGGPAKIGKNKISPDNPYFSQLEASVLEAKRSDELINRLNQN